MEIGSGTDSALITPIASKSNPPEPGIGVCQGS